MMAWDVIVYITRHWFNGLMPDPQQTTIGISNDVWLNISEHVIPVDFHLTFKNYHCQKCFHSRRLIQIMNPNKPGKGKVTLSLYIVFHVEVYIKAT